jgi:hypothetical protein
VQVDRRRLPLAAIDEVVPVGDLVVDRAAGVTVGDAAIHAARRLRLDLALGQRKDELLPMPDALGDRPVGTVFALEFQKAGRFSHSSVVRGN